VDGLLDLAVVPADLAAVGAQYVELARQVVLEPGAWQVEQVARVAVPGDQPQRLPLAAASNEDRWVGALQRVR
jgi:hypothetical protein